MGISYVFPGQGINLNQIDLSLFDKYKVVMDVVNSNLDFDFKDIIVNKKELINDTKYAQIIIFVLNHLYFLELIEKNGLPDNVIGHSLGEFNALVAGGYITFNEGLALVKERAKLMSENGIGVMYAILGDNYDELLKDIKECNNNLFDIANYNSPKQIVISGLNENVDKALEVIKKKHRCIKLNVSGAFHSRYMERANQLFKNKLDEIRFKEPNGIRVLSCVDASEYSVDSKVLYKHMTSSVEWIKLINAIIDKGDYRFIQVGAGDSMIKLINQIKFDRIIGGK